MNDQQLQQEFQVLQHEFHRVNRKLDRLLGVQDQEATDLTTLIEKVTSTKGTDESILALVNGLADELHDQVGMKELADKLRISADALKSAVLSSS